MIGSALFGVAKVPHRCLLDAWPRCGEGHMTFEQTNQKFARCNQVGCDNANWRKACSMGRSGPSRVIMESVAIRQRHEKRPSAFSAQ